MAELIDQDQEHLGLLRLGFFIMAAMTGVGTMFSLLFIGMGGFIASGGIPMGNGADGDPRFIGWIFIVIGGVFLTMGCGMTFLTYFTGRSLGERKHWTFCAVVAALCCFQFPVGTALGVCGLIVLNRPSVKALFAPQAMPPRIPL